MTAKAKKMSEATLVIDPVRMNIVNKIAAGSKSCGTVECLGGLLLQGEHQGGLVVNEGPLVLWEGSRLTGTIHVGGDAYVFGTLGSESDSQTTITVMGTLYLTAKAVVYGRMRYKKLSTYDGALIHGSLETLVDSHAAEQKKEVL